MASIPSTRARNSFPGLNDQDFIALYTTLNELPGSQGA
jgi:hypothetical protein